MWPHHDLAWWGVVLAIAALVLMFPANIFANIVTPMIRNWFSTRTRKALVKRIEELEKKLANLEKIPPLEEVQNEILWGVERLKVDVMGAQVNIILCIYLAARAIVSNEHSSEFKIFATFTLVIVLFEGVIIRLLVRRDNWRYLRSPSVRARLRESIAELRGKRDRWPT